MDNSSGTIRAATLADAAGLARLCASIGLASVGLELLRPGRGISRYLESGQLVVLDLGGNRLGAAAHVALTTDEDEVHAHLSFFAIHPSLAGTTAEDRMAAAVLALCEEAGCADIDVGAMAS